MSRLLIVRMSDPFPDIGLPAVTRHVSRGAAPRGAGVRCSPTAGGKTRPGQKTILDSLAPALETLKSSAECTDVASAARNAAEAAKKGADATVSLTSSVGRARWFQDRSVGTMDPGAWSGYLIIRTLGEHLAGEAT
ncbi:DAK2 domain-containing protein [Celeribacter indicus]|uniref:DAK2 domain-containing protein n=1 Tax=Celeribacter indicus TaxID=1208324 RepID=UPI0009E5580D|nr:DAK2 domain-containing protein [Celeribacter indicus]